MYYLRVSVIQEIQLQLSWLSCFIVFYKVEVKFLARFGMWSEGWIEEVPISLTILIAVS